MPHTMITPTIQSILLIGYAAYEKMHLWYNSCKHRMCPQVQNLMNKLGRKKWNVRICEKYPHGSGVLTYLARYLNQMAGLF